MENILIGNMLRNMLPLIFPVYLLYLSSVPNNILGFIIYIPQWDLTVNILVIYCDHDGTKL